MKKITFLFFIISFLFIYTHLCILYGVLKERKAKACIGPVELSTYESTLNTAQTICSTIASYKVSELNKCLSDKEGEITKWKNNYNWLKRQQLATSTPI